MSIVADGCEDVLVDVAPRWTPAKAREFLSGAISHDAQAVVLTDFFPDLVAHQLARAFAGLPWEPIFALVNGETTRFVLESEFESAKENERFSCSDTVRPNSDIFEPGRLPDIQRRNMERFLVWAVQGEGLRNWLCEALDFDVSGRVSFEFCRYEEDGFLSAHADNFGGRVLGLCLYLDPSWLPTDGGQLGHRDPDGRMERLEPRFNSLSLIPIGDGHVHWVESWKAKRPGRHSFSLGLHHAADK